MYLCQRFCLVLVMWVCFKMTSMAQQLKYKPTHDRIVGCYLQSWAVFRERQGKFSLTDHTDPSLCTHLMYTFVGIDETNHTIISRSPYGDYEAHYGLGGFKKITGLKKQYPHLKVLPTVGGWEEGSTKFSKMAKLASTRKVFVDSVVTLLREYNFDGLDFNWEFPSLRGGSEDDKVNFPLLLKDLREEFDKHSYLLTILISGKKYHIDHSFDLPALVQHVDWINLVTYQYNGPWENKTDSNAPLHSNDNLNVEYSVDLLLQGGVPKEKIVMGIASYGHTFIMLNQPEQPTFGLPISTENFMGEFTKLEGDIGFFEVCSMLKKANTTWKWYWDSLTETPFIVDGRRFVSYDDRESVKRKVNFMLKKQLRGAFLYSLDTDDFANTCSLPGFFGESSSTFPLLKTIHITIQDASQGWQAVVYSHEYGPPELMSNK